MRIFAFIFARGGSKGVPGKNIKEICGKPLIAYSIEIAKEIESIEKIYVSTEDDYIYREQLKHFFACIENKKPPSVSINDGVAVLQMIESAKKSHKIGKKVAIA